MYVKLTTDEVRALGVDPSGWPPHWHPALELGYAIGAADRAERCQRIDARQRHWLIAICDAAIVARVGGSVVLRKVLPNERDVRPFPLDATCRAALRRHLEAHTPGWA